MASISKASADRQKRALTDLLALPGNNICADCMGPAPRWTSWNIGVFICVQCATAHRKLGSHISKVRSVTLDTWTKEQVESMKNMGNIKANALYNPDPLRNPPPTNMEDSGRDSELDTYIRNKYQYKVFMKREAKSQQKSDSTSRPPDILVREPHRASTAGTSPSRNSYREAIEAVSPSASSLMADMQNHTRKLSVRTSADRARSTPPMETGGKPKLPLPSDYRDTSDMSFTSVGVTPQQASRPSTATGRLGSSAVPSITTTPPPIKARTATVSGGGFSWGGSAPSTSTITSSKPPVPSTSLPSSTIPPRTMTAPVSTVTPATTQQPPPPPPPAPVASLYEQDMMSLQFGGQPSAPSLPVSTNPFPQAGNPSFMAPNLPNGGQLGSPFASAPNMTGTTSPFGMGNVQAMTTGFGSMNMNGGIGTPNQSANMGMGMGMGAGMAAPNPFTGMQQSQSPPPMQYGGMGQQAGGAQFGGPSPHNPFGQQQPNNLSPFAQQLQQPVSSFQPSMTSFQPTSSPFQSTSSPFQSTSSPFQMAQPGTSPYQTNPQMQPTGSTPSPFPNQQQQSSFFQSGSQFQPQQQQQQQTTFQSPSPFQQQQQPQQQQFTGAPSYGGQPNNFSSFAQGMLPPTQQQQQQPSQAGYNPFMQQQQMGVNGWMG